MANIELTQGKIAIISDEDVGYISQFKWAYDRHNHCAVRGIWDPLTKTTKVVSMHRFLLDTPKGLDTDHKNGDRLDNRRENLRICEHSENLRNMKTPKSNTSGYKGVSKARSGRWVVKIRNKTVGTFTKKTDAARAYNSVAIEVFGEYARLNEIGV